MMLIKPHNQAKAFLSRYRALRAQYASVIRELEDLRGTLTGISAPIRSDIVSGSGAGDKMAAVVARIVDMEDDLADVAWDMSDAMAKINEAIHSVPDETQRAVLIMRYMEGLSWNAIMEKINYSERQTFVIHGRALVAVNEWLRNNAE